MKLIIVEGLDNTGKDDCLNYLINKYSDNHLYRHFGFPIGETNQEKIDYQKYSFQKEFSLYQTIEKDKYFNQNNEIYWNRSHIGEYVYGTIYRNYDPEWIFNLETLYGFDEKDIYLILLTADPEFLIKNDDGKSFSTKLSDKKREIKLFESAFQKSIIHNKLNIKVNENKKSYRSRESIRTEIENFIFGESKTS